MLNLVVYSTPAVGHERSTLLFDLKAFGSRPSEMVWDLGTMWLWVKNWELTALSSGLHHPTLADFIKSPQVVFFCFKPSTCQCSQFLAHAHAIPSLAPELSTEQRAALHDLYSRHGRVGEDATSELNFQERSWAGKYILANPVHTRHSPRYLIGIWCWFLYWPCLWILVSHYLIYDICICLWYLVISIGWRFWRLLGMNSWSPIKSFKIKPSNVQ